MNISKYLVAIFLFQFSTFSQGQVDLLYSKNILGTKLLVYRVPHEEYFYKIFTEKNQHIILEKDDSTAFLKNEDFYIYTGETSQNSTAFTVTGKNSTFVKGIGKIAYSKLLKVAKGEEVE